MGKLAEILSHPQEVPALVRIYLASKAATKLPKDPQLAFCYEILNNVSRSFAIVIQQLPNPLRDAICVFYLVLRGLDTVEDDMALPDSVKLPALLSFHKDIYERGFTLPCGYNHYKRLMAQFGTVVDVFLSLDPAFQLVIANITRRMGEGMAEFITKEVETVAEYDKYCHYVAGLVGIGLSQMFARSGLESPEFGAKEQLSNHMGLFLQKTNIIRDYLEDILEEPAPRMFWPRAVWSRYAAKLSDLKEPGNRQAAVQCLNHMVVDALQHLPACVQYMEGLRDRQVFRFCAIPQIMAAGTLALCYNNGAVFEGAVKMRRGQTAQVFDACSDMGDLFRWFLTFLSLLDKKVSGQVHGDDPTLQQAQALVAQHTQLCSTALAKWQASQQPASGSIAAWVRDYLLLTLAAVYAYYAFQMGTSLTGGGVPEQLRGLVDVLAAAPLLHRLLSALALLFTLRPAIFAAR
ncbi:farnesyl-diphosphate farnesyltransferase [Haematococcus lacustris]